MFPHPLVGVLKRARRLFDGILPQLPVGHANLAIGPFGREFGRPLTVRDCGIGRQGKEVRLAARENDTQIINTLRKAKVELANGNSVKEVCRGLGVSEQTSHASVSAEAATTDIALPNTTLLAASRYTPHASG